MGKSGRKGKRSERDVSEPNNRLINSKAYKEVIN